MMASSKTKKVIGETLDHQVLQDLLDLLALRFVISYS
jgi:hypothetical protein